MIEGDPDQRWRECRIVDVSSVGTGLELLDATAEEIEGHDIILALRLKDKVRLSSVHDDGDDRLRVGVQFVGLNDDKLDYISSLVDLGIRW